MAYRLPRDYRARSSVVSYTDAPGSLVYQPHVYRLAEFVAHRSGATHIVDVGCGAGEKLAALDGGLEIVCIDTPATLDGTRRRLQAATVLPGDLEFGLPQMDPELLRSAVVVCADVIEHLRNPERLARDLADAAALAPYVLVSTPDRDHARGVQDLGPPANPAHVMEWSLGEFVRFLGDCGFAELPLAGHTVNTDRHGAKTTSLVVAGRLARQPVPAPDFRVAAIINVYNERDILPEVVAHLVRDGVAVHVFDNWSTDGSYEAVQAMAAAGLVERVERFPDADAGEYDWAGLLQHTQAYAATVDADWVLHHDADEIRLSPWPGVGLRDAIAVVDRLGFNAIDFSVIDFRFLEEEPEACPPFEDALNWFEFGRRPGHFHQVKGWRNDRRQVELVTSGGHEAVFPERRVFPLKFLTKHYPLRTREQSRRKVFADRLPRVVREQTQRGWHTQYDDYRGLGDVQGWQRHRLQPWHPRLFADEFLVERLSGIGVVGR